MTFCHGFTRLRAGTHSGVQARMNTDCRCYSRTTNGERRITSNLPRIDADHSGLFNVYGEILCSGLIHKARAILIFAALIALCTAGCERRIVRKQERIFMHYAEKNWSKLTPRQKADYYEMLERQKDRAQREEAKEQQKKSRGF